MPNDNKCAEYYKKSWGMNLPEAEIDCSPFSETLNTHNNIEDQIYRQYIDNIYRSRDNYKTIINNLKCKTTI